MPNLGPPTCVSSHQKDKEQSTSGCVGFSSHTATNVYTYPDSTPRSLALEILIPSPGLAPEELSSWLAVCVRVKAKVMWLDGRLGTSGCKEAAAEAFQHATAYECYKITCFLAHTAMSRYQLGLLRKLRRSAIQDGFILRLEHWPHARLGERRRK